MLTVVVSTNSGVANGQESISDADSAWGQVRNFPHVFHLEHLLPRGLDERSRCQPRSGCVSHLSHASHP